MKNLLLSIAMLIALASFGQDKITFKTSKTYFSEDIKLTDYNEFTTNVSVSSYGDVSTLILNNKPSFYKILKKEQGYIIMANGNTHELVMVDKNNKKVYVVFNNYKGLKLTLYSNDTNILNKDMADLITYYKYYRDGQSMTDLKSRYLAIQGLLLKYYKKAE